jgi:thymidine kinase
MSLDIIFGPMFAGKTSRIQQIVSRYKAIGVKVFIIKHEIDDRYAYTEDVLVSHDQTLVRSDNSVQVAMVSSLRNNSVRVLMKECEVVIVDEAQFFDGLVAFVKDVVETQGKKLYLIGLDGDIKRMPFGELLECIPLADRVERLTSFCHGCRDGTPGLFSYRKSVDTDPQIVIGGGEMYESLCRACFLRRTASASRVPKTAK